ncbi:hypothetical protein WJX74_002676 [Apatococcus lobatus]|uniref:GYF domain-containing protein n=1 Tax=Apatococcus lobatus TaxID=904363 RepID=A0AAW1SBR2_9CHLO
MADRVSSKHYHSERDGLSASEDRERQHGRRGGLEAPDGDNRSAADGHGKSSKEARGRERISWSAWKGSQAMTRQGSDDGELPPAEAGDYHTERKASPPITQPSRPRSSSRGRHEALQQRPGDQPPGWDDRGGSSGEARSGRLRAHSAGRRSMARPFRDPPPYDARRLPPPYAEEELRRRRFDHERPEAFVGMMPDGFPPYPRTVPGDMHGRDLQHLPPPLPPRGHLHDEVGPFFDRAPPPGAMDHRRYRSPSPPPHLRGRHGLNPSWGPPSDLPPHARVVRYHHGPAWPSRPPSPGPHAIPRGFDPGRRPSNPLDHGLAPLHRFDPPRGSARQYPSPPRDFASRPSSGPEPHAARGRRPLSPSPPRRSQHLPHDAPTARYHAADGYGHRDRDWQLHNPGPGPASLRHGSASLPYRPQRDSSPSRMPLAADRLHMGGRMLPGGHYRGISPSRSRDYQEPLPGLSPRGFGAGGLAPLRHTERWEAANAGPSFRDNSRVSPHRVDSFSDPRLMPAAREKVDVGRHSGHAAAKGPLHTQQGARSHPQLPSLAGATSLPLPPAVRAREGRPSKQTGWDRQPSPEPGQVLRTSYPAPEAANAMYSGSPQSDTARPTQTVPDGQGDPDRKRRQLPAAAAKPRSGREHSPGIETVPASRLSRTKPGPADHADPKRPHSQPETRRSKHDGHHKGPDGQPADLKLPESGERPAARRSPPALKRDRSPVRDSRGQEGSLYEAKRSKTEPKKPDPKQLNQGMAGADLSRSSRDDHRGAARHQPDRRVDPKPADVRAPDNENGPSSAADGSQRLPAKAVSKPDEKPQSRAHGDSGPREGNRASTVPNGISAHRAGSPTRQSSRASAKISGPAAERSSKPANGRAKEEDGKEVRQVSGSGAGSAGRTDARNGKRAHSPARAAGTGKSVKDDMKKPRTEGSEQERDSSKGKEPPSKARALQQRKLQPADRHRPGEKPSRGSAKDGNQPPAARMQPGRHDKSNGPGPHSGSGSARDGAGVPSRDALTAAPEPVRLDQQLLKQGHEQSGTDVHRHHDHHAAAADHVSPEADPDLMPTAILKPDLSPTYEQLEASLERQQAEAAASERLKAHEAATANMQGIEGSHMEQQEARSSGRAGSNGWAADPDLQGAQAEVRPAGGMDASLVPLLVDPTPGWDARQEWSYMDPDGDSHGLFTIKQIRQWLSSMARKPDLRQQFEDFKVASVWRVNRADQRMPLYQVVSADGWEMSM